VTSTAPFDNQGGRDMQLHFIRNDAIEKRKYQLLDAEQTIRAAQQGKNTAVVYPTGTGKTFTAFLAADHFLQHGKVLFMAHTNALCKQHLDDIHFLFNFPQEQAKMLVGSVPAKKRPQLWEDCRFIVATPQTIQSELQKGTISFEDVSFVIFDEMHMAAKKYVYVDLARLCYIKRIPLLGLTASTGTGKKVSTLFRNYEIRCLLYRSTSDPLVRPYVFPKFSIREDISPHEDHTEAKVLLRHVMARVHNKLAGIKLFKPLSDNYDARKYLPFLTMKRLMALQPIVRKWCEKEHERNPQSRAWDYNQYYWAYRKLAHILNVFSTEDYRTALIYIQKKVFDELTHRFNAARILGENDAFLGFCNELTRMVSDNILHPKMRVLLTHVNRALEKQQKLIIFCNTFKVLEAVGQVLADHGITTEFAAGKQFMNDAERNEVTARFKNGHFPVLLSTQVFEAGIHLPALDIVINFSMPLTGIAQIQRRGRAGRVKFGAIYYLVMEKSNDTALYFSARRDNVKMDKELRAFQRKLQDPERSSALTPKPSESRPIKPSAEVLPEELPPLLQFGAQVRARRDELVTELPDLEEIIQPHLEANGNGHLLSLFPDLPIVPSPPRPKRRRQRRRKVKLPELFAPTDIASEPTQ